MKTLLLAALVPEVPTLRALTAPRLAALNHGSVVSPVQGREGGLVLQKLRNWAARVGEIRISDDAVPTVSLQITGVDIEPILANAAQSDNDGTRRTRVQKILFEARELPTTPPCSAPSRSCSTSIPGAAPAARWICISRRSATSATTACAGVRVPRC